MKIVAVNALLSCLRLVNYPFNALEFPLIRVMVDLVLAQKMLKGGLENKKAYRSRLGILYEHNLGLVCALLVPFSMECCQAAAATAPTQSCHHP